MELVTILRELWHRRTIVALVALVSLIVGAAVAFRLPSLESRKYEVGIATARILVDTPKSQVVEVAPQGSDTLGVRANLIASLMADGVVKDAIAKRAGLKLDELEGVAENTAGTSGAAAVEPTAFTADDHVLTTRVIQTPDGDRLPIIDIETQAPDTAGAAKLANAAVAGLRDYLDSRAASEEVTAAKRLRFTSLGPARAAEFVRGPGIPMAIGAALFVFVGGCAIMLGDPRARPRLARGRGGGDPHGGLPGGRLLRPAALHSAGRRRPARGCGRQPGVGRMAAGGAAQPGLSDRSRDFRASAGPALSLIGRCATAEDQPHIPRHR